MKIKCLFDKLVSIVSLKTHPKNRNQHPQDQIERLAKILDFQGWRYPVKVSKQSGFVTAGHGRIEAAKFLGWTEVPVNYQDYESEDQEYADLIADNAIAAWSELDFSAINNDMGSGDIGPFDLDLLGIKDFEVTFPGSNSGDEDDAPEPRPEDKRVKLGDLFVLGDHRLLCGDSTKLDNLQRLMNGSTADIGFTSPPYNANKNSGGLIEKKYKNSDDAMDDNEYLSFLSIATDLFLKNSRYSFVNIQMLSHNRTPLFEWQSAFKHKIKDILIWVKNIAPPQINPGTFNCKWEYLFCFSDDNKGRSFPCSWHGQFQNVIETENGGQNEFAGIHKATFPVSFPSWIIEKMDFAKSVLDIFGGSGSTLIACEKLKRKCFMMEIDPLYCSVILDRWAKYTGKDPVREDGAKWSDLTGNVSE